MSNPENPHRDEQVEKLHQFAATAGLEAELSKPHVIIPGGMQSITKSASKLFSIIAPTRKLFLLDGNVCQIAKENGILKVELLKSAAACSLFEKYVHFVKPEKNPDGEIQYVPTIISKETAEKYLTAEERRLLPEIEGIINCPLLAERNKALITVQGGYDSATKLFVTSEETIPLVFLSTAIDVLKYLLQDFNFQTPGDRSRALASFITPVLKFGGFIKGPIPADAAEADVSQSGKTYRQKMVAAVFNETCNVINKAEGSGVGSLEEAFSTCLVQGKPFIQFDNIRGKFSFQKLESFMTASGFFDARPAYSKVIRVNPAKFMIMISSNGYMTTPDLANRSSIIRIFKRQGYQFKQWERDGEVKGGMLDFINDGQPLMLGCVFAIVREWFEKGKPRTAETRHDFREWCQILDWIVQNIFNSAPLMDGHKEAQTRVASPDHTFIRAVAVELAAEGRLDVDIRARNIFEVCEEKDILIPGLTGEQKHNEDTANKVIGKIMGRLFAKVETIAVDTFVVSRRVTTETSSAMNPYQTRNYRFTRAREEPHETKSQPSQ